MSGILIAFVCWLKCHGRTKVLRKLITCYLNYSQRIMIHYLKQQIKLAFSRYPLIANCITYATFTTSAEFLQQSINNYDRLKDGDVSNQKVRDNYTLIDYSITFRIQLNEFTQICKWLLLYSQGYDFDSLLRYAFVGGGVLSPMLYGWYRILDKRLPGTTTKISIQKAVIDVVFCGIPYYTAFYCGKSLYPSYQKLEVYIVNLSKRRK